MPKFLATYLHPGGTTPLPDGTDNHLDSWVDDRGTLWRVVLDAMHLEAASWEASVRDKMFPRQRLLEVEEVDPSELEGGRLPSHDCGDDRTYEKGGAR